MRRFANYGRLGLVLSCAVAACAEQKPATSTTTLTQAVVNPNAPTTAEALDIATAAYVYGYALMTSEVMRLQSVTPMNRFESMKRAPTAAYHASSAPEVDMLESVAWLDLGEPQIVSHPKMGDRYYTFELLDMWTNVLDSPGQRTEGGNAASYLVTGPGWTGAVPKGMKQIRSRTRYVAVIGQIHWNGAEQDLRAVHALQAKLAIKPLVSMTTPRVDRVNTDLATRDKPQAVLLSLPGASYFDELSQLMCKTAQAAPDDAPLLARMAKIGLEPCTPFDATKLDPAVQSALAELPEHALEILDAHRSMVGKLENGWIVPTDLGSYGTDYMKRAVVAAFEWGANRPEDVATPFTEVSDDGLGLTGAHAYTLTFEKGDKPPVDALWSITLYEHDRYSRGFWLHANAENKYGVSPSDRLRYADDGSLTLYFQPDSPGKDKEANWVPTPSGDFALFMRMYSPKKEAPSILDGTWKPPAVHKEL